MKKELANSKAAQADWNNQSFTNKIEMALQIRVQLLAKVMEVLKSGKGARLKTPKPSHDFGDVVFLKEADPGDPSSSDFEAGSSVLESNAAEGEDRDVVLAGAPERIEASGLRLRRVFLFKDRREERQVGAVLASLLHIVRMMAGLPDNQTDRTGRPRRADIANVCSCDVIRAKMNARCPYRQSNIGTGVDEEGGFPFSIRNSSFLIFQDANCLSGQLFKFPGKKILFANLDVINPSSAGFGDFLEEALPASALVTRKLGAIGDVVQQGS